MKDIDFKELFKKLSEPLKCGAISSNGTRYQKSGGEYSSERIFVLSNELHKTKPTVMMRTYFDSDNSWRAAIKQYLRSDRAFLHPVLTLYCIEEDMVTTRNLNFDLNIL